MVVRRRSSLELGRRALGSHAPSDRGQIGDCPSIERRVVPFELSDPEQFAAGTIAYGHIGIGVRS
ncbi:hypothetical protein GCM10027405_09520 [Arthrobacter alkaliphilus]